MKKHTPIIAFCIVFLSLAGCGISYASYKLPPPEIVKIIDAPPPPAAIESPDHCYLLMVEQKYYPPISQLAQRRIPLAGTEINPDRFAKLCTTLTPGLSLLKVESQKTIPLILPEGANSGRPAWSYDSRHFAFTNQERDGLRLYVCSAGDGEIKAFPRVKVTDILDSPFTWQRDNRNILVRLVPGDGDNLPDRPEIPSGPVTEETTGKRATVKTYQNLLENEYDERLFRHYGRSQLAFLDTESGALTTIGKPGLYFSARVSPDGSCILVTRLNEPFSYEVPFHLFGRTIEVWDREGKALKTIATLPVQNDIPNEGVPKGPRELVWQELYPARLLWVEALDGGDSTVEAPFRDVLMSCTAPFTPENKAKPLLKIKNRFSQIQFFPSKDQVLLTEFDWKKQWTTSRRLDLSKPGNQGTTLFSRNIHDGYHDPGSPVYRVYDNSRWLIAMDGETIYLKGNGASKEGERPFLSRFTMTTLKSEMLFQSDKDAYERFIAFGSNSLTTIITRYESSQKPPNYYLTDLQSRRRVALTHYGDPVPELRGITSRLVKYTRKDGVALSGTLYLPAGYTPGRRLPLVIWAYPYDYSDASVAGQVRGTPNKFTFLRGASPLFFLTQGYAVLNGAAMPVVGDPETKNNTFIEQVVSSAEAAINHLDSEGIIDPRRVMVGGHSYGAFMTATLLANSRLFAAGIARSGAYNRSLTPFGFQNERRSFWEAPDVYVNVSPFTRADKIKDPLLIIHGINDDNPGTFPLQSERLFDAINGNGGTARLVLLPLESHGYVCRESVLDVIAEMLEWGERFVKNRKP